MQRLQPGVPQAGTVGHDLFTYYQLIVSEWQHDITFITTPISGNVGMFISTCSERFDRCDGGDGLVDKRPTLNPGTWTWNSDSSLSRESVVVRRGDENACVDCSFLVGVYGDTQASFSIMALHTHNTAVLQDGVPIRDYVRRGHRQFYQFEVGVIRAF